ncbi:trypsin-like peptidase domain-containing protein [Marinovum sp.]|uniref:S1C family serine protease n=1 Tax=Marinovum sp. TaxID=2024839 RepID=UPI003A8E69EE
MPTRKITRRMSLMLPLLPLLAKASDAVAHEAADVSALRRAMAATLVVTGADRDRAFLGSAVLWQDGRQAVTAAHVVGTRRALRLRDAEGRELNAEVTQIDAARDVAFLQLEGARAPGLSPRPGRAALGETVYAVGAPFEAAQTLTAGIVSASDRQVDPALPVRLIQHDAAINAGSSGGPLVDAEGRLIGLNSGLARASRFFAGMAYALPMELVQAVHDGRLRPVPRLGLRLRPVDAMIAEALGLSDTTGLLVDHVTPQGCAATAGLRPGDILLAVDGRPITGQGDLALRIDARAGASVSLGLRRGPETLSATLRFDPAEPAPALMGLTLSAQAAPAARGTSLQALGVTLSGRRVTALAATSPAYLAGLSVGDEILAFNGAPATAPWPEITGPVVLLVSAAGGQTRHVVFDPFSNQQGMRPIGGAVVLDPAVITL